MLLKLPKDRLAAVLKQSMLVRSRGYTSRQSFWLGQLILSTISLVLVLFYHYFTTTTRFLVNDRSSVFGINYIILVPFISFVCCADKPCNACYFAFWILRVKLKQPSFLSYELCLLLCSSSTKLLCHAQLSAGLECSKIDADE